MILFIQGFHPSKKGWNPFCLIIINPVSKPNSFRFYQSTGFLCQTGFSSYYRPGFGVKPELVMTINQVSMFIFSG